MDHQAATDRVLVIVSGLPGAGKSTLARPLATALGVPLLSKDVIKEALGDVLGPVDHSTSKRLGQAAVSVLYAVAREIARGVMDNHFLPEFNEELRLVSDVIIEVHCACPPELAAHRQMQRAEGRHPVHRDSARMGERTRVSERERPLDAVGQMWPLPSASPLALGGPLLAVDTSGPVDVAEIARWVREQQGW